MPVQHIWAYWIPVLVVESLLFALAIIKALRIGLAESGTSPILNTLLRDSVVYFGGMLAIILVNLIIYCTARVRRASSLLNAMTLTNRRPAGFPVQRGYRVGVYRLRRLALWSLSLNCERDRPMAALPSILGCRMLVRTFCFRNS